MRPAGKVPSHGKAPILSSEGLTRVDGRSKEEGEGYGTALAAVLMSMGRDEESRHRVSTNRRDSDEDIFRPSIS